MKNIYLFVNGVFAFFLPIIIPIFLGAISLTLQKFKFINIFRGVYATRRQALGEFTNQMVLGLFSFDLWVIIAFAEKTPVSYFYKINSFEQKYAIALVAFLLHLFTYIYSYTRENIEEFKEASENGVQQTRLKWLLRRDYRYLFLLILSFVLCIIVRL